MKALKAGHTLRVSGAAAAACVALAACGGGGGGATRASALDPAKMVPATAVLYASVAIRPQGSLKSNLIEEINSIGGKGTAQRLSARLEKSLGKQWKQLEPWVGETVGIALTGLPASRSGGSRALANDLLVVLPTDDPAAARRYLTKNAHSAGESWKVVGHYAIVGGAAAIGQAEATTSQTSLAAKSRFRSAMTQLGGGELFTLYAPLHQLLAAAAPLLKSEPAFTAADLARAEQQAPAGSSLAFGAAALHHQLRLDVIADGTHTTVSSSTRGAGVSSLPAGSWLALSLGGGLAQSSAVSELAKTLPKELATVQALSRRRSAIPSGPLRFVERDLIPALGPVTLSVTGTSLPTLQAGLVISPLDHSAGARLASGIKRLVIGLPISTSASAGRVAVTYGYSNLQQFIKPISILGQSVGFKSALSQLPRGSRASLYLDFAPIAALASLESGASGASALRVLHRLDYVIAGGTRSHFRLVLETN